MYAGKGDSTGVSYCSGHSCYRVSQVCVLIRAGKCRACAGLPRRDDRILRDAARRANATYCEPP